MFVLKGARRGAAAKGAGMVLRREVLLAGGVGVASIGSAMISGRAFGAENLSASGNVAFFLIDTSIADATGIAALAAAGGVSVLRYKGDVGAPWLSHLEPSWRDKPRAVVGVTFAGAFFCLERLAHSYGLRCTFRSAVPERAAIGALAASAFRLAARPAKPETQPSKVGDEAGDTPLIWVLQPAMRATSDQRKGLKWGAHDFSQ